MNAKQYKTCVAAIATGLGAAIAIAITQRNPIVPVIAVLAAIGVKLYCKSRLTEVVVDERDIKIRQKSSRWTITVFSIGAAVLAAIFYTLQPKYPRLEEIAQTLAYSACVLLLLDAAFYSLLSKQGE